MTEAKVALPKIAARQLSWFNRYIAFYLRRHFHGIHLLHAGNLDEVTGKPLLVILNHPSWWDPLLALYLSQHFFAGRRHYGPIAAAGLEKYRFFERLGFIGIDPATRSGAQRFLQVGQAVLAKPDAAFWVTAQGHFTDVRKTPVQIESGVGHLASRAAHFAVLPVAFEYSFWTERTPEAFASVGQPLLIRDGRDRTAKQWTATFAEMLERTQSALSARVIDRNTAAFEPLLSGRTGVSGVYDAWRRLKARCQGKKFTPEHGAI